jgi:hypothetical protein
MNWWRGRVLDDVDTQPQAGHTTGQALVGGVAPHQSEQAVGQPDPTEQLVASGDIGDVRRGDGHGHEQTEAVNQDMAFAAPDSFAGVVADLVGGTGVGHALGVQDGRGGLIGATVAVADLGSQGVDDLVPGAVGPPPAEPRVHRGARRQVMG